MIHDRYHFLSFSVQAADTFLKDACNILGITKDSPLTVVTNTGCTALPALLNLNQVMQTRHVIDIWSRDELPVSIIRSPPPPMLNALICCYSLTDWNRFGAGISISFNICLPNFKTNELRRESAYEISVRSCYNA